MWRRRRGNANTTARTARFMMGTPNQEGRDLARTHMQAEIDALKSSLESDVAAYVLVPSRIRFVVFAQ